MDYTQTLEYIHKVSWTGSRPGLQRIGALLGLLGNPQDGLRFVHVAGTNGKGSVCAFCDSVLRAAGYTAGLYTSPYIERFNERMMINGEPISDGELAEITTYVRSYADTLSDPPTEFELITAVAMVYFARHGCDPVVLEVGMGGRLDATNIIKTPLVSVITGISLDHTAVLGGTVALIAREKAGIIKDGVPVVSGADDPSALAVIREAAAEHGCELTVTDRAGAAVNASSLDGTDFTYKGKSYRITQAGLYQPGNAAVAVDTVLALRRRGLAISDTALADGLARAVWRGRFEVLSRKPLFIIDGSHNPEGIAAAVKSVKYYFGDRKICLLSGVMRDKNYAEMARELSPVAACAVTLLPDNPRALDPSLYADEFIRWGVPAEAFTDIREAVLRALDNAARLGTAVVALGSLYMYGDVKHALYEIL